MNRQRPDQGGIAVYKPFYHNSKSARTAGKQGLGTYKQRSFIIGQNRRDVKLKKICKLCAEVEVVV